MNDPHHDAALAELTHLNAQERVAHLTKNARALVSTFADDYININRGVISRPTREASIERLQAYFDRSTFLEWDDIEPPIIHISADASMAYAIIHKRVRLVAEDAEGQPQEHTVIFAWMEVWEKRDERWQLMAVASTNEP